MPKINDAIQVPSTLESEKIELLQLYIETLEKTNSQLGLWTNPYGIAIGILTLLIGFGAIIVTVIIFRMNRDYKKIADEQFAKHKEHIDQINKSHETRISDLISESQNNLKIAEENMDALIKKMRRELKNADKKDKQRIQEMIDRAVEEKAKLPATLAFNNLQPAAITLWNTNDSKLRFGMKNDGISVGFYATCSTCGKMFEKKEDPTYKFSNFSVLTAPQCPECRNVSSG